MNILLLQHKFLRLLRFLIALFVAEIFTESLLEEKSRKKSNAAAGESMMENVAKYYQILEKLGKRWEKCSTILIEMLPGKVCIRLIKKFDVLTKFL